MRFPIRFMALAASFTVATGPAAQEPIDGIAAVVNGEIISIGEVRRAARLAADQAPEILDAGCGGTARTGADAGQQEALECLIDQRLVFREVRRFPQFDISNEQLDTVWSQVEALYPDPAQRAAELARFGLTERSLRADLRRQLLISAYIDSRFRATVDISEGEARSYFEQTLVPDMHERGIAPPVFEEVDDEYVFPILREREVNRRVESWVADLRARATIVRRFP